MLKGALQEHQDNNEWVGFCWPLFPRFAAAEEKVPSKAEDELLSMMWLRTFQ